MKKPATLPAAPAQPFPTNSARPRRPIRLRELLDHYYPVSEAQLYKEIAEGLFPKPFKLTPGGRAAFWWDTQVEDTVEARAAASLENDNSAPSHAKPALTKPPPGPPDGRELATQRDNSAAHASSQARKTNSARGAK